MPTLICECGKRLNAAGAVPGRVGKCPACGARLVVGESPMLPETPVIASRPEVDDTPPGYAVAASPRPATFIKPRSPSLASASPPRATAGPSSTTGWLSYPLRDVGGLGVLAFLPPLLWVTSLLSAGLFPTYVLGGEQFISFGAMTMVFPMTILWALAMGRFLTYLELVVGSSSRGESHHPRLPVWDVFSLLAPWARMLTAIAAGVFIPAVVVVIYWVVAGEFNLLDRLWVGVLLGLGTTYSAIAYAAIVLHGDPMAANPLTILGAIRRAGLGPSLRMAAVVGGLLSTVLAGAIGLFFVPGFLAPVLLTYPYWVATLYLMMVAARVLGLFYRRHAQALGWFPDRPRWGA